MDKILRSIIGIVLIATLVGCAPSGYSGKNRDYKQVDRGSFRGSFYTVNKGDTLYYIAYITDRNVNNLIRFNNIKAPYTLRVGQRIKLWHPDYKDTTPVYSSSKPVAVAQASTTKSPQTAQTTAQSSGQTSTNLQNSATAKVDQQSTKEYVGSKQGVNSVATSKPPANKAVSSWKWPTKGRVINKFSSGEQGNKGIDIAGQRGQSVISAASGSVVYSGSALRGYGNLIIVKHNDDYLSAYAHNDSLLVQEGQTVSAGQKIATMGSSGTSGVKLHFEIRYQGKSVNPERYLP
ncbi:membrane protein [Vibrio inusitatus NBRC 102082]|uniref:Membrane protein n=1 Tax=Vibrio inusitatus NBRC 102082 TaxID=1219070 RepID=A0A4Y3I0J8_9VIBR|nr:murein hydrolase activator NlpD [Vibrio inusitatus]GEA52382.1 membrane protein [Vibrio inusitatus NBRC 102082]